MQIRFELCFSVHCFFGWCDCSHMVLTIQTLAYCGTVTQFIAIVSAFQNYL